MRTETIQLYSVQGHSLRHVSFRQAKEMVELGQAELVRLRDGSGRIKGEALKLLSLDRASHSSPCHITANEMHVNGLTQAMKREERISLSKEDIAYIRRIESKIEVWPLIGDDKAVRVSCARA